MDAASAQLQRVIFAQQQTLQRQEKALQEQQALIEDLRRKDELSASALSALSYRVSVLEQQLRTHGSQASPTQPQAPQAADSPQAYETQHPKNESHTHTQPQSQIEVDAPLFRPFGGIRQIESRQESQEPHAQETLPKPQVQPQNQADQAQAQLFRSFAGIRLIESTQESQEPRAQEPIPRPYVQRAQTHRTLEYQPQTQADQEQSQLFRSFRGIRPDESNHEPQELPSHMWRSVRGTKPRELQKKENQEQLVEQRLMLRCTICSSNVEHMVTPESCRIRHCSDVLGSGFAVGSKPFAIDRFTRGVITVQAMPGDWLVLGIISNSQPSSDSFRDPTHYGWGCCGGQVYTRGKPAKGTGGWEGWQPGDVGIFEFDPISRRLKLYLKRLKMRYIIGDLPIHQADIAFRLHVSFLVPGTIVHISTAERVAMAA